MTPLPPLSPTVIWLVLMALTLGSWFLSTLPSKSQGLAATAGILVIALIKARMVLRHFMDVSEAPVWLRYAVDAWALLLLAGLMFQQL